MATNQTVKLRFQLLIKTFWLVIKTQLNVERIPEKLISQLIFDILLFFSGKTSSVLDI